jgi:hypothetical protein
LGQLLQGEDAIASLQKGIEVLQSALDSKVIPHFIKTWHHGTICVRPVASTYRRMHMTVCNSQEYDEGEEEDELKSRLCSALCCLAETRMGEAGEVSEVAHDCEALLLRAANADGTSPEPMQVSPLVRLTDAGRLVVCAVPGTL